MIKVFNKSIKEVFLEELVSKEKRAIISGPFGSNISKKYFKNTGVPVIRGNNLSLNYEKFIDDGFVFVTEEKAEKLNTFAILNDVVFTAVGTLGQVGIIHDGLKYSKYVISNKQLRVRVDLSKIDINYLFYWLSSPWMRTIIKKRNVGSTVPLINLGIVRKLSVLYPENIFYQKKISKVLSDLDKKIELNNKINQQLELMAKTLYDYWFVQFDFPDENGNPYKSSGGKMVYDKKLKREIPEGWEVDKLNSYVELILDHRGKTPKKLGGDWSEKKSGIIALSAKTIKNGKLVNLEKANKVDQEMFDKWMPEKLKDGDFLMTSEAPTGEFYFLHGKTDYCMSQRLFAIRADQSKVYSSYLYFEMSKGHGFSQIMGSRSGSTVAGIRQDELRKILMVKPCHSLQKKFDDIALPLLKQIKCIDRQNYKLEKLRDWLLPMLMNGQVTVK